jgi:hypothetical protein
VAIPAGFQSTHRHISQRFTSPASPHHSSLRSPLPVLGENVVLFRHDRMACKPAVDDAGRVGSELVGRGVIVKHGVGSSLGVREALLMSYPSARYVVVRHGLRSRCALLVSSLAFLKVGGVYLCTTGNGRTPSTLNSRITGNLATETHLAGKRVNQDLIAKSRTIP